MQSERAIEQRSASDVSPKMFARELFAKERPVILKGLASSWEATATWSLDGLVARFGDRQVTGMAWYGDSLTDAFRYTWVRDTLAAWASDRLAPSSKKHGFVACPLPMLGPDAMSAVGRLDPFMPLPALARRVGLASTRPPELWINQAGTASPLHFSASHNLLAQVSGTKEITLYEASQGPLLGYPSREAALLRGPPGVTFTTFDPDAPDPIRFPRAHEARPIRGTISPGDVLFIPSRMWQLTRFPETSVSLSFFWSTPTSLAKNAAVLARSAWLRVEEPFRAG